jgi:hypothetical protein
MAAFYKFLSANGPKGRMPLFVKLSRRDSTFDDECAAFVQRTKSAWKLILYACTISLVGVNSVLAE